MSVKWYSRTWVLWIAGFASLTCMCAAILAAGWAGVAYGVVAVLLGIHVLANDEARRLRRRATHCSHPYANVTEDGRVFCRYCGTEIVEEMGG